MYRFQKKSIAALAVVIILASVLVFTKTWQHLGLAVVALFDTSAPGTSNQERDQGPKNDLDDLPNPADSAQMGAVQATDTRGFSLSGKPIAKAALEQALLNYFREHPDVTGGLSPNQLRLDYL